MGEGAGGQGKTSALAAEHLDLAKQIARRMAARLPGHLDRDDLESTAMVGLVEAARRWDRAGGVPFRAFASIRIEGAIRDWLRLIDPLSRDERRKGSASPVLLSGQAFHDGPDVLDLVAGDADVAADAAANAAREQLRFALWRLPRPERHVLEGLAAGRTLGELGAELGVTESRACQLATEGKEILAQRLLPWEEVTPDQRRAWLRAGGGGRRRSHCIRGHKLAGYNVAESRRGDGATFRMCRRCRQETLRRRLRAAGTVPMAKFRPKPHPGRKLGRAEVLEIVEAVGKGERQTAIAARFGVARRVIRLIAKGEAYREILRPRVQPRPRGMTDAEATAVIKLLSAGVRPSALAKRMGASPTTIWEVRIGRTFPHLPRPATWPEPTGPRNTTRKLTVDQVGEILAALAAGEKGVDIARRFGTSMHMVSRIRTGKAYRDVPRPPGLS